MPTQTKTSKAKAVKELYDAFLALKNPDECRRFLGDVCTPKEISDLAERWMIARMLDEGELSYREIHAITGVSVTTIGRVARFLVDENYKGYRLLIDRMSKKK